MTDIYWLILICAIHRVRDHHGDQTLCDGAEQNRVASSEDRDHDNGEGVVQDRNRGDDDILDLCHSRTKDQNINQGMEQTQSGRYIRYNTGKVVPLRDRNRSCR